MIQLVENQRRLDVFDKMFKSINVGCNIYCATEFRRIEGRDSHIKGYRLGWKRFGNEWGFGVMTTSYRQFFDGSGRVEEVISISEDPIDHMEVEVRIESVAHLGELVGAVAHTLREQEDMLVNFYVELMRRWEVGELENAEVSRRIEQRTVRPCGVIWTRAAMLSDAVLPPATLSNKEDTISASLERNESIDPWDVRNKNTPCPHFNGYVVGTIECQRCSFYIGVHGGEKILCNLTSGWVDDWLV
jgi:hypothetical protein